MSATLHEQARKMLTRPDALCSLATLSPDGSPLQALLWFLVRDDAIVVNSRVGRHWPANLQRDPRCSLIVEDESGWVSVRALAQVLGDREQGQADIAEMARRYSTPEQARIAIASFRPQERISFLLRPTAVTIHPDDTIGAPQIEEASRHL